jgi:hypothetical protein
LLHPSPHTPHIFPYAVTGNRKSERGEKIFFLNILDILSIESKKVGGNHEKLSSIFDLRSSSFDIVEQREAATTLKKVCVWTQSPINTTTKENSNPRGGGKVYSCPCADDSSLLLCVTYPEICGQSQR